MKNLIGGLFNTQESANLAYAALQDAGFAGEQINMFVHKPRKSTARALDVSVQDIARNAIVGALILGALGGILGFLVGTGALPFPGLEPGPVEIDPLFVAVFVISGIVGGVLTGAILGVVSKLLRSQEKAEVMTRQIDKRGVLVTVSADDVQDEARARRVMEENGAVELGSPSEKWDVDAWSSPNETNPSLSNLANTR